MKRMLIGSTVVALLGLLCFSPARTQDKGTLRDFMRAKLEHSQKVIEGLAMEDFPLIEKHSQELSLLSQAEMWQVVQTPEYLQHSTEFRRAADALNDAAEDKNIDGAALAYMEVTLKCVNCHKYVRKVRMASLERPAAAE
jgi:cytochrome c556